MAFLPLPETFLADVDLAEGRIDVAATQWRESMAAGQRVWRPAPSAMVFQVSNCKDFLDHLRAGLAGVPAAEQLAELRRACERDSPVGDTLREGVTLSFEFEPS